MDPALLQGLAVPTEVQIAMILSNLLIRLAAIAAGVYVAKLGHDTILREAKGEVEFSHGENKFKSNIPGPFFAVAGILAIGWALGTKLEIAPSYETATRERAAVASPGEPQHPPGPVGKLPFERPADAPAQ